MSKQSDLILDIMDEIDRAEMSFSQIAIQYGLSYEEVDAIHNQMLEEVQYDEVSYDHMERDHDEAYEPDYPDPDSWYDEQYDLHDF